jgi:DnaJ family protein C protein 8
LHALKRFEKAKESYQRVLELDPNNAAAKRGVEDCQREIRQQQQAHLEQEEETKQQKQQQQTTEDTSNPQEENDEDDEDDDDLNDFFADVEEVTTKKKAENDYEKHKQPKATNAIKNDKSVLGTFDFQVDRLLQTNSEWRNLNPFYVLMLPGNASEDDISRRYKAVSLILHPDKNGGSERAQQAYDQVQKAKITLNDPDRARHARALAEEGMKSGEVVWKRSGKKGTLKDIQDKEVMRIFAQVERKRRDVEDRERKYEQRERQQEDDELEKERKSRQFDKKWRDEERVDKRVGNWRDFEANPKKKKKV